ncbi:winged helix-turn-helix domain-containing protein [Pseudonocardia xishanensis]|uniref:HTH gntR-type domain-containing protein n=1 Tax=Pseudonocardia xishanensis TaxID=630995 RepID=A0ABP8REF6_9PSEU
MTERSGSPKYLQVAGELRRAIRTGTYPVGSTLPSTAQLTRSFDVSTTVVRAAIRELRDEGLVFGQPGKAVYVAAEPADVDELPGDLAQQVRELSANLNAAIHSLNQRVAALEEQLRMTDR